MIPTFRTIAKPRRHDHHRLIDVMRIHQAFIGLPEQIDGQSDERYRIDEGGENAAAMVAEGSRFVRRLRLQIHAEHRERKRERVGEIMAGIG